MKLFRTEEKRKNWKQEPAEEQQKKQQKRNNLIEQIDTKRKEINAASSARNWVLYDKLMQEKAELQAELSLL